jgi:hypothetical protein
MRRLAFLIPALAVLGGCSEGLYYQTRYIPTDIESTYSASEQLTWSGDRETYELPAAPPDLEGTHRPRVDCTYPYQKFKPIAVVGYGDERPRSSADIGVITPGGTDDRIHPDGPTVAMAAPPVAGNDGRPQYRSDVPPALYSPAAGAGDQRPHSTTGAGTNAIPVNPAGGWNSHANPYCCDDGPSPAVDQYGRPVGR